MLMGILNERTTMSVKIETTYRQLAETALRSPGYSVVAADFGWEGQLTNIRYAARENGRRDKSVVLADYSGTTGRFNADDEVCILD
jgi:hypothetical protein